jgi:hypothetical protein
MNKLDIKNEMALFDDKNVDFYDSLSEEEQKKISPFVLIRWGSLVSGDPDLQEYYLLSCNENLNKNFFNIRASEHKKLLWLKATTVSPGMGRQRHSWLSKPKDTMGNSKAEKFLQEVYPELKADEIKLLAEINDRDDLKCLARELGWDEKRIKSDL